MMRSLGRLLQIVGLIIPLLAILSQLEGRISVGQMLMFLVAAMALFWIGQLLHSRRGG